MSVQDILYSRCILGHKIGGFRASEGLPNKHECLSLDYANYGNQILAAVLHCLEKNSTLQFRDRKYLNEEYKRFAKPYVSYKEYYFSFCFVLLKNFSKVSIDVRK